MPDVFPEINKSCFTIASEDVQRFYIYQAAIAPVIQYFLAYELELLLFNGEYLSYNP